MKFSTISLYTLWAVFSSAVVIAAPSPIAETGTHLLVRRGELATKLEKAPSNCGGIHRLECHRYYKRVRAACTLIGRKAMALETALSKFGLAHQPGAYPKILKYANLQEVESERQRVESRLLEAENAFGDLVSTIRLNKNQLPDLAYSVVENDLDFPTIKKVVRFYYDLMLAANMKKSERMSIEKFLNELRIP